MADVRRSGKCGSDGLTTHYVWWSVGLTTNHLRRSALKALRECCPHVHFQRMGGAEPVSEDLKRQALSAADLAVVFG